VSADAPVNKHISGSVSLEQEQRSPGLFYTFVSRASKADDLSFTTPPTIDFFKRLARFPSWERLMAEEARLGALASDQPVDTAGFAADWHAFFGNALSGTYGDWSSALANRLRGSIAFTLLQDKLVQDTRTALARWRAAIAHPPGDT
jgi:hypothetical protein